MKRPETPGTGERSLTYWLRQATYLHLLTIQHRLRRPSRIIALAAVWACPVSRAEKRAEMRRLFRR